MLIQQTAFKTIFDSRRATAFCVLVALLNKILISWLHSDLEADKALYLLLTKSFLDTGLMTEPVSVVETGKTIQLYNPAVHSPLYVLVAAPFLWLTKSYFTTQLLVSITGWIIFFTGLYKTARTFFHERWLANVFVLFAGFFLYPHELASPPKDTLAVGLVLWAIYFAYRFIQHDPNWKNTCLLFGSVACIGLIKLLYIPIAIVILLVLLIFVVQKRRQHLVHYFGLMALLFVLGATVYFFILQPAYAIADKHTVHLITDGTSFNRGFFPENLKNTYPFVSSSILNTNFWGVQIEKATGIFFGKIMNFLRIVDVVAIVLLVVLLFRGRRKLYNQKTEFLLVLLSLTMVSTAAYLSITHEAYSYKSANGFFTYVMEPRTFILPMIAIQLFLFRFVFSLGRFRGFKIAILVLLLLECLHGLYFTAKQTLNAKEVLAAKANNSPSKKLASLLKNEKKDFILITTDNSLRRYAIINGINTLAITDLPMDSASLERNNYLIATHAADSVFLKKFPSTELKAVDAIPPLVLHTLRPGN